MNNNLRNNHIYEHQGCEHHKNLYSAMEAETLQMLICGLKEQAQQYERLLAALELRLIQQTRLREPSMNTMLVRLSQVEADVHRLSSEIQTIKIPSPSRPQPSLSTGLLLGSVIVSAFPPLFSDFQGKKFLLRWRGNRDGFKVRDFHDRCDGHSNTLALILEKKGNIFGGFTPLAWESDCCYKSDTSLCSFLFTLKNPYNTPAKRFPLKPERKDSAIHCHPALGPSFGGTCDLSIGAYTDFENGSNSYGFGRECTNDTGLGGKPGDSTFSCWFELFHCQRY
jgi:hypothetical protein